MFSDIISLNEEIKSLKEKVSSFTHLQNVQVTSEISSIQIEEQLDALENENQQLKETIEIIASEKKGLEQKIEELSKEKQDLNTKLEYYIQVSKEKIVWDGDIFISRKDFLMVEFLSSDSFQT